MGEYQRSSVLWCVRTATWEEDTYIFRVFIPCTLCNDDRRHIAVELWTQDYVPRSGALPLWSSPQHSRHSSLLKQWSFAAALRPTPPQPGGTRPRPGSGSAAQPFSTIISCAIYLCPDCNECCHLGSHGFVAIFSSQAHVGVNFQSSLSRQLFPVPIYIFPLPG